MWTTTGPKFQPLPDRHQFWNLELPELDGVKVCLCKKDTPGSTYDFKTFTLSVSVPDLYTSFYETVYHLGTLDEFQEKGLRLLSLDLDEQIKEAEDRIVALKKLKRGKEILVHSLGELKEILRAEGMT